MRFLLLVFSILISCNPVNGQSMPESRWHLDMRAGWSRSATSDLLLNHYKYSGKSLLNFKLQGSYLKVRHRFGIQLSGNSSKLYPDNINPLYYEYNYLNRTLGELRLAYLYRITKGQRHFNIYGGGCNASIYSIQDEIHRSLLYSYGLNHRKSYLFSPINLMPFLYVEYVKGKMMLNTSFSYGIFNLSARPDDNYVKQIDIDYKRHWSLYFPDQFSSFRYSVVCQYNLRKAGVSLSYDLSYDEVNEYKSLHKAILAGINISL